MQEQTIRKNLLQIQEDIAPWKPNIIAITKYYDEDAIIAAYSAGLRDFGESRAVEAIKKIENLPEEIKGNSKFHFIGHLQSNKVKKVVSHFDFIHSMDSIELARKISDEALAIGKVQPIFLEVNISGEQQKFGFSESELRESFPAINALEGIRLMGLMSMAPLGAEEGRIKEIFDTVVGLQSELNNTYGSVMRDISMGMSQDYKIAANSGATYLRIGRKLFN
jgi:pyridoxal phosphate enzyme (YggS family)